MNGKITKNIAYIVEVVCAILFVYFYYGLQKMNRMQTKVIERLQEENANMSYKIENMIVLSKLQHSMEGRNVQDVWLYDKNNNISQFDELYRNGYRLGYFISEQSCSVCYQSFLNVLKEASNTIEKSKIVLICKFENRRNFQAFIKDHDLDFDVYRTEEDFGLFEEYNDYPIVFRITPDLRMENVIITDKTNHEMSNDYLKIMQTKLSNH